MSERELLEWAASFSPRAEEKLRRLQCAEAKARVDREQLEWLAAISERHERKLRELLRKEAQEREAQERSRRLAEAKWVAADHPRQPKGIPEGGEWIAKDGGGGAANGGTGSGAHAPSSHAPLGLSKHPHVDLPPKVGWSASSGSSELGPVTSAGAEPFQMAAYRPGQNPAQFVATGNPSGESKRGSFLGALTKRNQTIADLTGVVTPGMIRSNRIAAALQSAVRLPGDVARAAAAGLGTGGKAVLNGAATAVKGVATLGLSTSQLELIGVTKEDRDRGYDTAVSIATGSGQILIAVGTGGITSALSKGGSIAQAANGALIAYDAAGNAVGVVQGVYDASKNGVSIHNGVQIAGGLLGLQANAKGMTDLGRAVAARRLKEIDEYVAKLPRRRTPTKSAAGQYEVRHTGPYNYTVAGGGVTFNIDGYRGSTILDAKHVGNAKISPYVPGSSCPDFVRAERSRILVKSLRRFERLLRAAQRPSSRSRSLPIL